MSPTRPRGYLCHRIREAVKDVGHEELLRGIVECDEAFYWRQSKEHAQQAQSPAPAVPGSMRFDHKVAVLGALERNGDVRLEVCREKQLTRQVLHDFIKAKLSDETAIVVTDDFNHSVADNNTKHETVSYTKKSECAASFTRTDSKAFGVYSSGQSSALITKSPSNIWMGISTSSSSDSTTAQTLSCYATRC